MLFAAALFAGAAAATNIVTFKSFDSVDRTVYVTPNAGYAAMDSFSVAAGASVDVEFAEGWIGNAYAVHNGAANTPGMLAEFNFQGWNGLTYFDVSAIVSNTDVDNVQQMYPAEEPSTPVSGCTSWPCNNAYYLPDDLQTKSTEQTHIIVTLNTNNNVAKRNDDGDDAQNVARRFVTSDY